MMKARQALAESLLKISTDSTSSKQYKPYTSSRMVLPSQARKRFLILKSVSLSQMLLTVYIQMIL
jgi:hypothetical protein